MTEAALTGGPAHAARAEFKAPVLLPAEITCAARAASGRTLLELRGGENGCSSPGEAVSGTASTPPA
ncbi:hypothetical protein ACWGJT_09105 [Streptomyces xantholiticus]